jgi:hypothetical protein
VWKSEAVLTAVATAEPGDCITERRLVELTGRAPKDIEMSCLRLRKHGLLVRTSGDCHKLTRAGLAAVAEGKTIRSGPQGPRTGRVVQKGSLRARAWRAMRIKRKFTVADIAMLCVEGGERDVESNLLKYLWGLERAGYVKKLPVRERGTAPTSNGYVRWMLLVDNGPLPPVWRQAHGTLYDPNVEADICLARGEQV